MTGTGNAIVSTPVIAQSDPTSLPQNDIGRISLNNKYHLIKY